MQYPGFHFSHSDRCPIGYLIFSYRHLPETGMFFSYSGMMPRTIANSMHRIEKTHTYMKDALM